MLFSTAGPDLGGIAIQTFAGYGVVGIVAVVLAVIVKILWSNDRKDSAAALEREVERTAQERERADRAEQLNLDLNRELREKVVPLLTEVARVTADQLAANRNRDR